jgi:SAM-dependent methyltransferase
LSPNFYNENATDLAKQYLSKSFEEVHQTWSDFLSSIIKNPNTRILDLGAGSGRDAKYLAELAAKTHNEKNNTQILAVEQAKELSLIGRQTTRNLNIKWLEDSLPALSNVTQQEVSFDVILRSAVWMHIPKSDRARSIRKLANLLIPGGKLVISLRHGQTDEERKERKMHTVCADELKKLATDVGLFTKLETQKEEDKLGRSHISWQTVILQMPDGYPGAVLRRESSPFGDRVILPAGLVALSWCHQYKDLIDTHQLYQTSNKNPNMGFMKPDGWCKLTHRTTSDYRISNLFTGDDAIALHKTISAAASNIKTMPCRFITQANIDKTVFEVDSKMVKTKYSIFLDLKTLEQWGEFSLPESTWLAFNRHACWIEPVLVSEWVKIIASYSGNAEYASPEKQYHLYQALTWLYPKRTTTEVCKRFTQLQHKLPRQDQIRCVWSAKSLTKNYDIDHCMPFAVGLIMTYGIY